MTGLPPIKCIIPINNIWVTKWETYHLTYAQQTLKLAHASAQSHQSRLTTWKHFASLVIYNAPSEDSDQTAQMPMLNWIFTGHTSEGTFSHIAAHLSNVQVAPEFVGLFTGVNANDEIKPWNQAPDSPSVSPALIGRGHLVMRRFLTRVRCAKPNMLLTLVFLPGARSDCEKVYYEMYLLASYLYKLVLITI